MGKLKALVVSGSVGVGKTSVGDAIGEILSEREIKSALIDMDHLRWAYHRPEGDPFLRTLAMQNLRSIFPNYVAAGIERLIISDVIETQENIEDMKSAMPGAEITIIRLKASIETIHERIRGRDTGEALKWSLKRSIVLNEQMDTNNLEDFTFDTDGLTAHEVAKLVIDNLQI